MVSLLWPLGFAVLIVCARLLVGVWFAEQRRRTVLSLGPLGVRAPTGRHQIAAERLHGELARKEAEMAAVFEGARPRPAKVNPDLLGSSFSEAEFLDFAVDVFTSAHAARGDRSWEEVGVALGEAARELLMAGPPLTGRPRVRAVESQLLETHADEVWRVVLVRFDALADEPRADGPLPVTIRETWRFQIRADVPLPAPPRRGPSAGWAVPSIPDGVRRVLSAPRPPLLGPADAPAPAADLAVRCAALALDPEEVCATACARWPAALAGDASVVAGPAAAALARDRMEDEILGVARRIEDLQTQEATLIRVRSDAGGDVAELWLRYLARAWLERPDGLVIGGIQDQPVPQARMVALRRAGPEDWKVWALDPGT